jgi:hypothetical protein
MKSERTASELVAFWLEECEQSDRLTEWEESFIDSISNLPSTQTLTGKQFDKLKEIYERVTS